MTDQITPSQFHEAEGVEDWRLTSEGATAFFRTRSLPRRSVRLAISEMPSVEDHRPSVDVRHDGVTVHMIPTTYFGLAAYAGVGWPGRSRQLRGSWAALTRPLSRAWLLTSWRNQHRPGDAVLASGAWIRASARYDEDSDPHDRGPAFWFEQMIEPRGDGGGAIHVGIWVPYEQAEARIAAALAAGGRMVRDEFAPSWWTLADPAGNEADIATTKGRD